MVLQKTPGIEDFGTIKWDLALVLFVAWVVVYFCIFKGPKSTGKVSVDVRKGAIEQNLKPGCGSALSNHRQDSYGLMRLSVHGWFLLVLANDHSNFFLTEQLSAWK